VYDVDGSDISWRFKPLGDDDFSQIKIHQPAPFGSRLKIDVNVFDYDSNWTVTWRLDGVDKGRMYNYEALDPHANELYADHEKSWCRPTLTKHLFYGYLPTDYSNIEVFATDRFGRTHTCRYDASSGSLTSTDMQTLHIAVDNRILTIASTAAAASIDVYSASGRLCISQNDTCKVDLSALPDGIYIVRLRMSDGNRFVEKIILH
ncbi:MAG: calcineurin-like phosphoesterase C-terminal domain-containing protein, partial [Muribaculaceae bacterium]|nr:calcineurin-like phosphoesterase C-terminal domain-containing protein [Muribaculaceae bacterium]